MKTITASAWIILAACPLARSHAAMSGTESLPRSTPEAQGVSFSALLEFIAAADTQIDSMNSFMLVRHGHVIAEGWWAPYAADVPHVMYSLSKSFTSTAVGLAVAEGRLSVHDPVLKFFPEQAPAQPGDNLKAMRVSDLLMMTTGHETEPRRSDEEPWTTSFLKQPVPHKPGTHFLYNTQATYMLSAIVQKVTGEKVLDYLGPRLFKPLGIANPTWGESPQGVTLGGFGLNIATEDIARFGQLYLQKGRWQGKQLVPESWVEAATARQTANGSDPESDWNQGYGYQFWRCRFGAYRGDGAHGQYCILIPEHDAVVAITSGVRSMQAVMDLVWEKILPALQDGKLAPDAAVHGQLQKKLAALSVRMPQGAATSTLAPKVAGRTYMFPENERGISSLTVEVGNGATTLVVRGPKLGEQRIAVGHGAWKNGRTTFGSDYDARSPVLYETAVAGAGAWTGNDTFTARLCLYETPYYLTLQLQFGGDLVVLDSEYSVRFGPTKLPVLVGRAQ